MTKIQNMGKTFFAAFLLAVRSITHFYKIILFIGVDRCSSVAYSEEVVAKKVANERCYRSLICMSAERNENTLPTPQLGDLIQTFAMQVMVACGKLPNPLTNQTEVDLAMAQYHIGVLELVREKTRGNLTPDEAGLLDQMLHEVQMVYVEARKSAS